MKITTTLVTILYLKDILMTFWDVLNLFTENNNHLPSIYYLPKLQKNPIKPKFVIAAPTLFAKPLLLKYFTFAFKIVFS